MNRPAGVIVSAVFLIIGCLFLALTGSFLLIADKLAPPETPQLPFMASMMIITSVFTFACAVWGLATAVGLIQMRGWARISIIVIGALLVIFCGLSLVMMMVVMPTVMPPEATGPGIDIVRAVMGVVYGVPIVIGAWWLIYFNRGTVKMAFLQGSEAEASTGPSRPLSITVIAWHAIAFGAMTPLYTWFGWPAYIFGLFLTGWAAVATYFALAALQLAIGIGLLKLKPWAHTAAIAFCLFPMLHGIFFALLTDKAKLMAAMEPYYSPEIRKNPLVLSDSFYWLIVAFILLTFGTALWYLLTRKKAFLQAATAAQGNSGEAPAAPAP